LRQARLRLIRRLVTSHRKKNMTNCSQSLFE